MRWVGFNALYPSRVVEGHVNCLFELAAVFEKKREGLLENKSV